MALSRHVASIRSAIDSGNSIVMRLVARSVRGRVMSFIRRFLHYLVAISKRKRYNLRMQQFHNATCPEVQFLDRGKGVLHLPPEVAIELVGLVKAVTKDWDKQKRDEIRSDAAYARRRQRLLKAQTQQKRPEPAAPFGLLAVKLTEAAWKAGMSVSSLTVLSDGNDPYTSWKRRADAEVFARLFNRLVVSGEKKHLRGLFYRCIMLPETVLWPTGKSLVNTYGNWVKFQKASNAARWLGLVPFSQILDARNDEAEIFVPEHDQTTTGITGGDAVDLPADIAAVLPRFYLDGFQALQTYRIIFYGEKTSLAEVLRPIARAIGAEMVLVTGDCP